MKKSVKFSIKNAEKLYKKMGETMETLKQSNFSDFKNIQDKQVENWITVGSSSDFDKKLTIVSSWQTGVKY